MIKTQIVPTTPMVQPAKRVNGVKLPVNLGQRNQEKGLYLCSLQCINNTDCINHLHTAEEGSNVSGISHPTLAVDKLELAYLTEKSKKFCRKGILFSTSVIEKHVKWGRFLQPKSERRVNLKSC